MEKTLTICALVGMFLSVMTGAVQADNWTISMTVDNQYNIYSGDSFLTTPISIGGDNNWTTTETWGAVGVSPSDYLYVSTASDYHVAQGFIGTFTNLTTGSIIKTGDTAWEVFPAGAYSDTNPYGVGNWPVNQMPTSVQVQTAVAYAQANNLWVAPTTVAGYDNDLSTSISPNTWQWSIRPGIDPSASWIWYDSGNDPGLLNYRPAPFNGFNHDEFLVFRIAGAAPEPATISLICMGALALIRRRRK